MEITVHVTLQIDADDPEGTITPSIAKDAAQQAVVNAVTRASDNGFEHSYAGWVSIGLVGIGSDVYV